MTKIEWAEKTWSPVVGCSRVSPGCLNCYAISFAHRLAANPKLGEQNPYRGLTMRHENGQLDWTGEVRLLPERLEIPLQWRKPCRIFVDSMSDLFYEDLMDNDVHRVFDAMETAPHHIYQVLTKRPQRMFEFLSYQRPLAVRTLGDHLWLGVSVENRATLHRIETLRQVLAAIRFLSLEPLLEDLGELNLDGISWCIVGGESGPRARPMHPEWARNLRDQCVAAGVLYFFKQWGAWCPCQIDVSNNVIRAENGKHYPYLPDVHPIKHRDWYYWSDGTLSVREGKKHAGRLLDGREWNEYPRSSQYDGGVESYQGDSGNERVCRDEHGNYRDLHSRRMESP